MFNRPYISVRFPDLNARAYQRALRTGQKQELLTPATQQSVKVLARESAKIEKSLVAFGEAQIGITGTINALEDMSQNLEIAIDGVMRAQGDDDLLSIKKRTLEAMQNVSKFNYGNLSFGNEKSNTFVADGNAGLENVFASAKAGDVDIMMNGNLKGYFGFQAQDLSKDGNILRVTSKNGENIATICVGNVSPADKNSISLAPGSSVNNVVATLNALFQGSYAGQKLRAVNNGNTVLVLSEKSYLQETFKVDINGNEPAIYNGSTTDFETITNNMITGCASFEDYMKLSGAAFLAPLSITAESQSKEDLAASLFRAIRDSKFDVAISPIDEIGNVNQANNFATAKEFIKDRYNQIKIGADKSSVLDITNGKMGVPQARIAGYNITITYNDQNGPQSLKGKLLVPCINDDLDGKLYFRQAFLNDSTSIVACNLEGSGISLGICGSTIKLGEQSNDDSALTIPNFFGVDDETECYAYDTLEAFSNRLKDNLVDAFAQSMQAVEVKSKRGVQAVFSLDSLSKSGYLEVLSAVQTADNKIRINYVTQEAGGITTRTKDFDLTLALNNIFDASKAIGAYRPDSLDDGYKIVVPDISGLNQESILKEILDALNSSRRGVKVEQVTYDLPLVNWNNSMYPEESNIANREIIVNGLNNNLSWVRNKLNKAEQTFGLAEADQQYLEEKNEKLQALYGNYTEVSEFDMQEFHAKIDQSKAREKMLNMYNAILLNQKLEQTQQVLLMMQHLLNKSAAAAAA